MDHTDAVRLHAVEKYVLGELPQAQRDEFEEHYFDCADCISDLKAAAVFIEGSRQVLHEASRGKAAAKHPVGLGARWFGWLRPAFAVPALAALLLVVVYQNAVTIPQLKDEPSRGVPAEIVKSFYLPASTARGASSLSIAVHEGEDFGLDVDLPPDSSGLGYVAQIQDAAGRPRISLPVSAEQARKSVHFHIRGGVLPAGKYDLVVMSMHPQAGAQAGRHEVTRTSFTVEFLP
jgi:Putative zinc-finger